MKIFWRVLRYILLTIVAVFTLGFLLLVLDTNYQKVHLTQEQIRSIPVIKQYTPKDSVWYQDLLAKFGKNKNLPRGYELQALLALSHYPELAETPIDFLVEEAIIPLSSRPNPFHLFQPWRTRRYLVVISTKSWEIVEPILMHNLPFDEQVGVLGHELAHTVFYVDKSALHLVGIGLSYPFSNFRKRFERDTDKRAIAHGLGYQLLSYAIFVRNVMQKQPNLPETFSDVEDSYLTPEEIKTEMKKHPEFYQK